MSNPLLFNQPTGNDTLLITFSVGDIRKVKIIQKEIIQRIYYAVRDEAWLNIPYTLINYSSRKVDGKTILSYELLFEKDTIDFRVHVNVTVAEGFIIIETSGTSCSDFKKNRIGLCVHLPASLKGIPCQVIHSDNTQTISVFPALISPHQPFKNISEINWMHDEKKIKIAFEGDVFEMEDQRNWTDASYKIYSTPLDFPFPVEVKKGDTFYQKITISLTDIENFTLKDTEEVTANSLLTCPNIGIFDFNNLNALDTKKQLFSFTRIDFRLHKHSWKDDILQTMERALNPQLPIYCVLYLSEKYKAEIKDFLHFIEEMQLNKNIHSVALLSSQSFVLSDAVLEEICFDLHVALPTSRIGGGTDANFAQLNRNRANTDSLDFLFYSIQPQEHASDKLSIIENIMGQYDTVATAKSFSRGKDIDISALSFYRRFNANVDFVTKKDTLKDYNHKGTNFETAWYIGAMHQLIVAGVKSVTLVCSLEQDSPLLKFFHYMATFRPEYFYSEGSFSPEEYSFISWKSKGKKYSVFANLTSEALELTHGDKKVALAPNEIVYKESDALI